ncbi:MAG: nucleoside recognition protein [Deltaproteobacteria bacterium]|nr:nucleoside recognition protein [Deltaproteobacteria bacterium]
MKTASETALPSFGATLRQGLRKGVIASLGVIKVMFPVTVAVSLMKITPLLGWLADAFRPLMGLFGLPGETALPFILGGLLNLYVAIGAMIPLGLTPREITILAAMLLISHNLPVETAVIKGIGAPWVQLLLLRIGGALLLGFLLSLVL